MHTCNIIKSNIIQTNDGFIFVSDEKNKYWLVNYIGDSEKVVLPENINNMKYGIISYAFTNNLKLTDITIPKTVNSIGFSAFNNCKNLSSIILPFVGNTSNSLTNNTLDYILGNIKNRKFNKIVILDSENIYLNMFNEIKVEKLILPNNLKVIKQYAFKSCAIDYIVINSNIEVIENNAIYLNKGLNKIVYNGSKLQWSKVKIHPNIKTEIKSSKLCF